ncbi:MAG TPA: hypothetical protein VFP68_24105 [Burkholderiaceae bacterium]|nr:hypothetical protein [Burkholderiaceae bacterium]
MEIDRPRRPIPLPSFGPRRVTVAQGGRIVIDEMLPPAHRPLPVPLERLERYSALMAAQGWPAHVSRLAYDRIYAAERFSFARRVGRGELVGLAHELLQAWRTSRSSSDCL